MFYIINFIIMPGWKNQLVESGSLWGITDNPLPNFEDVKKDWILARNLLDDKDGISINDTIGVLQRWRRSNFTDMDLWILATDTSMNLLNQFREIYANSAFDQYDKDFIPLDNKFAILLILENGNKAIQDYKLWRDISEEEMQKCNKDFEEGWNDGFFGINIENSWRIKTNYEINNDTIRLIVEKEND